MHGKKDVVPVAFLVAATILIIAGGLISAINSAAPFDRGSWLAAYLVLVGGVAQAALAYGRAATGAPTLSRTEGIRILVLWNFGSLVVPLGVLIDVGMVIGLGSAALLLALLLFTRGVRDGHASAPAADSQSSQTTGMMIGYLAGAALLAVSVAIGWVLTDAPLLG